MLSSNRCDVSDIAVSVAIVDGFTTEPVFIQNANSPKSWLKIYGYPFYEKRGLNVGEMNELHPKPLDFSMIDWNDWNTWED